MISFYIGSLQILGPTIATYRLQAPLEGLEMPGLRVTNYEKPGEDGQVVSSAFYDARSVTLTGEVDGSTAAEFRLARQALAAACAIQKDSSGFPVLTRFTFTTLDGVTYFFDGQVTRAKWSLENPTVSSFFIDVLVPDPRIYQSGLNTSGLISPPVGGGFILPIILPVTFSPSSGGSSTANNSGNILTYPILTLKGQLTNPYILNSTIGQSMQLNRVIDGGETVVIDMKEKTLTLGGSTSLLTTKASDSTWWGLQPGVNNITFSSGSASDTGALEITWYTAVLGV